MHLLTTILLLLLLRPAEPFRKRGPRSGAAERGTGGRVRGRGRAGLMRRQTQECKEYVEAGEKYLDCQDRQLTTVMQDWPKDIHHLLLARNKIQVCTDTFKYKEARHRAPATIQTRPTIINRFWEYLPNPSVFCELVLQASDSDPKPSQLVDTPSICAPFIWGRDQRQICLLCVCVCECRFLFIC